MSADDKRKRLAEWVVSRREQLGMRTRQDLAEATGLSYRVLGDLERGARGVSEGTLAIVEQGLRWAPGSGRTILDGGKPEPQNDVPAALNMAHAPGSTESVAAIRGLSEAYGIAAELTEQGDGAIAARLSRALGHISKVVTAETAGHSNADAPANDNHPPDRSPIVVRIALGARLRRLRQERGIPLDRASAAIMASDAKVSRLESGRAGFRERDIRNLLRCYGVTDPAELKKFLDMARQANLPGWWRQFGDVLPPWFETYLGLEQAAGTIRTYEAQLIPDLLQTADYAHAVVSAAYSNDLVERRVALRMRRQQRLFHPDGPAIWAVIDESTLHRHVGGAHTLRRQIEHLVEVATTPKITIQVLPYSAGAHPASGGSFSILTFAEPEFPDIAYTEHLTGAIYLDRQPDLHQYRSVMDALSVQAEPPERTLELFTARLADL